MRIQFRNISQGQYLNINTFNLKDKNKKKTQKKINYDIEHTFSYKSKNPKKKKKYNLQHSYFITRSNIM